jgi:hypothetical protein
MELWTNVQFEPTTLSGFLIPNFKNCNFRNEYVGWDKAHGYVFCSLYELLIHRHTDAEKVHISSLRTHLIGH